MEEAVLRPPSPAHPGPRASSSNPHERAQLPHPQATCWSRTVARPHTTHVPAAPSVGGGLAHNCPVPSGQSKAAFPPGRQGARSGDAPHKHSRCSGLSLVAASSRLRGAEHKALPAWRL